MKRWPTKPLGELIAIEKGKKAPEALVAPTRTSLRYLQIEDLRQNATVKYCEPFSCPRATKSDVIIAWDGANAGTVSCNLDGHIGSTLAILRPIAASLLSAHFLSRFLQGKFDYLQKTATGATIPHISKGALTALHLPVPPLAEQGRVVKLLDEADELRKLRAKADSRTADLIPALFHEIFGDPFSRPKDWPVVRVDEAGRVQLGRQRAPKYQTGKFTRPYVRVANVFEDQIDVSDLLSMDFDKRDFAQYRLEHGDILLNEGQSTELVGRPAMWRNEVPDCCFQNTLVRFQADKERVLPDFALAMFLAYFREGTFANISSKTSNVAHLGAGRFAKIPFPLPPISVQKEFAARVTEVRAVQAEQAASRRRLEDLFQSMLHRAFNGEL